MHRYIDELVPVYIVFRTPLVEEDVLKSYLARLAINLEVFAFSTAPSPDIDSKTAPPKEQIYGDIINNSVEPVIVRHEEGTPYTYVAWKIEVFICESCLFNNFVFLVSELCRSTTWAVSQARHLLSANCIT